MNAEVTGQRQHAGPHQHAPAPERATDPVCGMIFNLTGVILAEMYASRDGIGHQIAIWGENFQMKQLLAGVVMIAAIAMPSQKTFEAFASLVEAGDYVGAIEQFYAPDASTRENTRAPVIGRDTLMARERGVMAAFRKIEAARIGPSLIDGDTVVARWKFTFTGADGAVRTLEEIAWQTWRGEQLLEEHFFYDPNQMAG